MAKIIKNGEKRNYYLEKDVLEKLDEFCAKTGRTKTKVIELALTKYIEDHKNEM